MTKTSKWLLGAVGAAGLALGAAGCEPVGYTAYGGYYVDNPGYAYGGYPYGGVGVGVYAPGRYAARAPYYYRGGGRYYGGYRGGYYGRSYGTYRTPYRGGAYIRR